MIESLSITQGNFKVHLGEMIRGINQKGVKFIKILPDYCAMLVKAQPSGKDGRHVCTVYFPDMFKDQLVGFADILQGKVGQEDLVEDEYVTDDQQDKQEQVSETLPMVESSLIASTLKRQQEYQAEKDLLTADMQVLIIGNIFEKHATGWIEKKDLFKLLDSFKLAIASRKVIGRLLGFGYLEKDPANPEKRSKLTQSACLLINPQIAPVVPVIAISQEDEKILKMIEDIKIASNEFCVLTQERVGILEDIEKLSRRKPLLEQRLAAFTKIITKKIAEIEENIKNKHLAEDEIVLKITPRMVEANRRMELLNNELPL